MLKNRGCLFVKYWYKLKAVCWLSRDLGTGAFMQRWN